MSAGSVSETSVQSKSSLNDLRMFRIQKSEVSTMIDEYSSIKTELVPGRKRIKVLQDSDSENEINPTNVKKLKGDDDANEINADGTENDKRDDVDDDDNISVKEKENRFSIAVKLEPEYDTMDIQDSLVRCNWNVTRAIEYLKQKYNKRGYNRIVTKNGTSTTQKTKSKKSCDSDDSENDNYGMQKQSEQVYDSDDSDTEAASIMTSQRKVVFDFFNNATVNELLTVKSCSEKKVAIIMELRPFSDWNDLKDKLENSKGLSGDLLNNCQDLINKQNNIANIMAKCKKLVEKLEAAIETGAGITNQPNILNKNLKLAEYQLIGLNWLAVMHKQKMNGILADEMGLGKTIQVIAFLAYLKENNLSKGTNLIVVPSSTLDNWEDEINKWCPSLKIEKYYGTQDERRTMRIKYAKEGFDGIDIILTTYHQVASSPEERKMFRVSKLHYVIFDEAHMLKNMTTQRYAQLITINAEMRILLTGTPLQNNLLELMSLLCFVMPSFFAKNTEDIKTLFQKKGKKENEDQSMFEKNQVETAKRIMKPFVLRRLKKDVLKYLPKKTEYIKKIPMTDLQKQRYKELCEYYSNAKGEIKGTSETAGCAIMMEMRKLSNHPLLLRYYYSDDTVMEISKKLAMCSTYKKENPQYIFEELACMSDFQIWQLCDKNDIHDFEIPDNLIVESGKFNVLDNLLPKLKDNGHRVLMFSQFTMMLDIVERYLSIRKYGYLRLDGQTVVTERQELIDSFNENSDIFIFLLSTKAGGMGINLTAADVVILHDIDFNPYNDKQAEDRCHRMGQTKPVNIYRFISEGTIEEGMLMVAQEKLKLEQEIQGNGGKDDVQEHKCMVRLLTMALGLDEKHAEILMSQQQQQHQQQQQQQNKIS